MQLSVRKRIVFCHGKEEDGDCAKSTLSLHIDHVKSYLRTDHKHCEHIVYAKSHKHSDDAKRRGYMGQISKL